MRKNPVNLDYDELELLTDLLAERHSYLQELGRRQQLAPEPALSNVRALHNKLDQLRSIVYELEPRFKNEPLASPPNPL